MKIRCFLLASLLLSPTLVQASDNLKHGSSAILSLRQLSDLSGDPLPQDILNVVGQTLNALERQGVWLPEGSGKGWVPLARVVEVMTAFRDGKSSEADVMAFLEAEEQIKEGLLVALSARWDKGLEDLMMGHRQYEGQLNPGKAYGAAFLAYHRIVLLVAWNAAWNVAWYAVSHPASNAAWHAASNAASNAAWYAVSHPASNAAWYAASNATYKASYNASWHAASNAASNATHNDATCAAHAFVKPRVMLWAAKSASKFAQISYDLAELFTLLWLYEHGHEYMKTAFDAAYEMFPEMELDEVKAKIAAVLDAAAIKRPELKDNMFIKSLWQDLDALEKFVLAE